MNTKFTNFIIKHEKFYKCLNKNIRALISDLDTYADTLTILPIYNRTIFEPNSTTVDYMTEENDYAQNVYIYIGKNKDFKYYYECEYHDRSKILYMSFGRLISVTKKCQEFDFNNCKIQ